MNRVWFSLECFPCKRLGSGEILRGGGGGGGGGGFDGQAWNSLIHNTIHFLFFSSKDVRSVLLLFSLLLYHLQFFYLHISPI